MPELNDPVCHLIRLRRRARGWSLARLAKAAGLASPAYVLYIESGTKIPSEEVASRIAKALDEDPVLFAAWARTRSRGDLATILDGARTLMRLLDLGATPTPAAAPPPSSRVADARSEALPFHDANDEIVGVPLYAEGSPPPDSSVETDAIDVLRIGRGAFPPGAAPTRPFAYRLTAHGARRVTDALRPGDLVVLSRDRDAPMDDAVYAVRAGTRIELGRVRLVDGALQLRRGSDRDEHDPVVTAAGTDPLDALAGRVVLALRRWL